MYRSTLSLTSALDGAGV